LAKSVVGLAVIFLGGDNRRPPYVPDIILIIFIGVPRVTGAVAMGKA